MRRAPMAVSPPSFNQHPVGCFHISGKRLISVRSWRAVALCLLLSPGLVGCSGHYRFSDNDYRPLGEPVAVNRGN